MKRKFKIMTGIILMVCIMFHLAIGLYGSKPPVQNNIEIVKAS